MRLGVLALVAACSGEPAQHQITEPGDLLTDDGRVREARVDERQHVPLLDEAALEAAKKWVFSPAQVNGHAVSVWSAIPFSFRLQ